MHSVYITSNFFSQSQRPEANPNQDRCNARVGTTSSCWIGCLIQSSTGGPIPDKYREKSNLKRHLSTFSIELHWVSRIPNMDVIHHLGLGERDWIHWEGLEVVWLECLKIRGWTFAQKRFQWILEPMNCEAHGNRKCCFNMFNPEKVYGLCHWLWPTKELGMESGFYETALLQMCTNVFKWDVWNAY